MSDFKQRLQNFVVTERLIQPDSREQNDFTAKKQQIESLFSALVHTKQSSKGIYQDFRTQIGSSLVGKLKYWVLGKLGNVVRNVVEKSLTTQQKYNQQLLEVVKYQQQILEMQHEKILDLSESNKE